MSDPFKWKILSSQHLLKDRWISLRRDSCELPNGKVIEPYYIYEYLSWSHVFGLTTDQQVLLVKQYRHGIQQTIFEFPSGNPLSDQESSEETARRELLEETGYGYESLTYLGQYVDSPAKFTNVTHSFLAEGLRYQEPPNLDEFEQIEIVFVSLAELWRMVQDGRFFQASHVATFFMAMRHLNKLSITL